MHKSKLFRQLLEKPGLVLRPCGYDALSALLIEKAGFELMGTSGWFLAASCGKIELEFPESKIYN